MLFFGLDPSLSETGLSVIDEDGYHETMSYKTVNKKKIKGNIIEYDIEDRILRIENRIMEFILNYDTVDTDLICIEGLAVSRVGRATHVLAGLHYCVRTKLYENKYFNVKIVYPSTLKKFVLQKHNKKGTKKQQMLLHIYKRWGQEFNNDNMADAFALAQYGRYQNGFGDGK